MAADEPIVVYAAGAKEVEQKCEALDVLAVVSRRA
jgi:hypothetical protein